MTTVKLRNSVLGTLVVGLAALALAGCGGASSTPKAIVTNANQTAKPLDGTSYGTNVVDINVVPGAITMVNDDATGTAAGTTGYAAGVHHDIIAPANLVVKSGAKVTIHAWNYDGGPHTITLHDPSQIPGFNFVIAAGKENPDKSVTPVESTTTFTAPTTPKGTILDIAWHCALPCDGPTHLGMETEGNNFEGYDGVMAGHIVVMA
jgi:hypothetical protein